MMGFRVAAILLTINAVIHVLGVRAYGTKDLVALEDGTMNPPSRGQTREQRYWFHKIANVLCALPKTASPARRPHSPRSGNAEYREHAEKAARAFVSGCGRSGPRHREDHRRPRRAARSRTLRQRGPRRP